MADREFVTVGHVGDVEPGTAKVVYAGTKRIALCLVGWYRWLT